jgi:Mg2+/Co2+ transporter CorC
MHYPELSKLTDKEWAREYPATTEVIEEYFDREPYPSFDKMVNNEAWKERLVEAFIYDEAKKKDWLMEIIKSNKLLFEMMFYKSLTAYERLMEAQEREVRDATNWFARQR